MMDPYNPKDLCRLMQIIRGSRSEDDKSDFWDELLSGPDRNAGISGQAFLENAVTKTLSMLLARDDKHTVRLIGDEERGGELGFSDQCRLLYGLGLIGPNILSDFLTVARIRNKFGHSHRSPKFTTPAIADACESLWTPDNLRMPCRVADCRKHLPNQRARGRYIYTLYVAEHGLALELMLREELYSSGRPMWMH
jgi:DNA-binding MltR family transcriptional regulator